MNREEAIRKIRWHLLGLALTDDVREAFNTLIPELMEKGTDEKMLDAILCHVKASNDFTANGVSKEDVVAYLEGKKKKAAIESAYPTSMPEEYGMRKPAERYDIVAKLEEHLANTPREQLDAEWKALEKWNDVGPTVEEYIYGKTPKFKVGDKIRKIGGNYASWEITGINSILRLYEGKYEEGYPTELSFEEQDSYELATDEPINAENNTVDIPVTELVENKDEKVRKWLFNLFDSRHSNFVEELDNYNGNVTRKEILAYLEKQKELPTNEEMLRTLRAEYEKGVADTIVKYEKKQEWSEEEKRKLNRIYEILGHAADDKGFLKSKRIIGDKEAIELQDFLKSLSLNLKKKNEDLAKLCSNEWSEEEYGRLFDIEHYLDGTLQLSPDRKIACIVFLKSLRLQPKHEWSEEEKMDIELLIALLRGKVNPAEILDSRKESIITFLKSLHLQPKNEWSDEDKEIIDNAIKQLYRYADSYHNGGNYTREKEVRKVAYELKSLNPSWKPNDVRYYEAWGVPKINGVPVPTETQTADISGNVKLKGWVKRKTADGTLRLYESKSCEDRGIWVPPWALKDSWKVCTTDDPIEVEITLKQL